MKNLRKWTALAAVMAMTATLFTGCGSTDASASGATAPAAESTAAATTETGAETPATDGELAADVQAIVDRGVLRVGVKNAVVGFGFQDTLTGEYSGLEISLAEKIAESLGVDVEFTAKPQLQEPSFWIPAILTVYWLLSPSPMRESRAGISPLLILQTM